MKTLNGHNDCVHNQVIHLREDTIASTGSGNKTIRVSEIKADKEEIQALQDNFGVCSLLKLKDIL